MRGEPPGERDRAYILLLSAARAACEAETNRADAETFHAQRALVLAATQLRALTEASGTVAEHSAARVERQSERLELSGMIEAESALAATAANELETVLRKNAVAISERDAALLALQSEARTWETEARAAAADGAQLQLEHSAASEAVLAAREHIACLRGELAVALEKSDDSDSGSTAVLRSAHAQELATARAEHAAALEASELEHTDAVHDLEVALTECQRKRADELRRSIANVGAIRAEHAAALAAVEERGALRVDEPVAALSGDDEVGGDAQEGTTALKKKRRKRKKKKKK